MPKKYLSAEEIVKFISLLRGNYTLQLPLVQASQKQESEQPSSQASEKAS